MSTLPFLLSVADELDNLHSQSYMDDFGLGFHPHRQYYRTPTIQLSLPASTDWMQDRQRCRTHKLFAESVQNNYDATAEELEAAEATYTTNSSGMQHDSANSDNNASTYIDTYGDRCYVSSSAAGRVTAADCGGSGPGSSADAASTSAGSRLKYAAALNANVPAATTAAATTAKATAGQHPQHQQRQRNQHQQRHSNNDDDIDNIDNSVRMYNLSKKCCKNYYRHAAEIGAKGEKCSGSNSLATSSINSSSNSNCHTNGTHESYRLHTKCLEGSISSSEESLQKMSSPIEFLTCFLVKKSRTPKHSTATATAAATAIASTDSKKS